MFRLARGLSLSPFRREWLVKDVVADLISKPTMIGYMNGLALTILVGPLPKLFGFKVSAEGLIGEFTAFVKGRAQGPGSRQDRAVRSHSHDRSGPLFPTVEAAVTAFRAGTGADWTPAVQPEADPTAADPTART